MSLLAPVSPADAVVVAVRRRRSRAWFVAWICVASLVLLEVVLQVGALLVWATQPTPAARGADERVILCVGDSWSQGMGSSDPITRSYPARVQAELAAAGTPWRVVNCGQSGRNSRELLELLPAQLEEFRPEFVCVLVGQNDYWTVPAELSGDELDRRAASTAYRFRWRVPRMIAWFTGKVTGAGQAATQHSASRAGPEWQPRTAKASSPYWALPMPWTPARATDALKAEGWRLDAAGDLPAAFDRFARAHAACSDDGQAIQMLASLHRRLGRNAQAMALLDELRTKWKATQDYWYGSSFVYALSACGQWQEGAAVAETMVERFPDEGSQWRMLAEFRFYLGQHDAGIRAVERALGIAPDEWSWYVRYKLYLLGKQDLDEALRSLFRWYAQLNDATALERCLRAVDKKEAAERARQVVAALDCPDDTKSRMLQVVADVETAAAGNGVDRVLSAHLAMVRVVCERAGAVPVFLGYPTPNPADATLHRFVVGSGARCVDVRAGFESRRGNRPIGELLAPDGHCNDDGYLIMGAVVAAGLRPMLSPR